jgi:hypothetical protein
MVLHLSSVHSGLGFGMRARDNPFRTERMLEVRYRLEGIGWEELLRRFEKLGYRAALIGPHGSGKTTLIESLEPRLNALGFETRVIRLTAEQQHFVRWTPTFGPPNAEIKLGSRGLRD